MMSDNVWAGLGGRERQRERERERERDRERERERKSDTVVRSLRVGIIN